MSSNDRNKNKALLIIFFPNTLEKEWEEVYPCLIPPSFIKSYNNWKLEEGSKTMKKHRVPCRRVHPDAEIRLSRADAKGNLM